MAKKKVQDEVKPAAQAAAAPSAPAKNEKQIHMAKDHVSFTKMIKVRILRDVRVPGYSCAVGSEVELPENLVVELEKPYRGTMSHAGTIDAKNARFHMIRRVERV